MECEHFKFSKYFNFFFKLKKSFTMWKWGVMCMTYEAKFYFMMQKSKYARVVNIFWYDSKL